MIDPLLCELSSGGFELQTEKRIPSEKVLKQRHFSFLKGELK